MGVCVCVYIHLCGETSCLAEVCTLVCTAFLGYNSEQKFKRINDILRNKEAINNLAIVREKHRRYFKRLGEIDFM